MLKALNPIVSMTSHRIWTNLKTGPWVKWGTRLHLPLPYKTTLDVKLTLNCHYRSHITCRVKKIINHSNRGYWLLQSSQQKFSIGWEGNI